MHLDIELSPQIYLLVGLDLCPYLDRQKRKNSYWHSVNASVSMTEKKHRQPLAFS